MTDEIPTINEIRTFMHCAMCIDELNTVVEESPRNYAQLEVGMTELGLQVWCRRHECNVIHINFEGVDHPATTEVAPPLAAVPDDHE